MNIFIEIGLILFLATAVCFIIRLLKQPIIVGYILSGIIIGPYFFNFTNSKDAVELFSKFGIAILLFIVGLNLKPNVMREVGRASLITGLGQIIITSGLGFFVMKLLHFSTTASLYGAIALTFSSTIIALKLISDKNDMEKLYGKISVGILLIQDIFATIVLLVVSILGSSSFAKGNMVNFGLILLGKGVLFFIGLYLISKYVLPRLTNFLAKSHELFFLFSISWGLGLAVVFYLCGFSLEIGALAAGVALSTSRFSEEIASRMKPLRDFFILLFFIMLGSQMVFSNIGHTIVPAIILSLFIMVSKPVIVVFIMNLFGYHKRTSFSTGLAISQISEFSLILMALVLSFGHVDREVVSLITLVGVITIIGSTYLSLYIDNLYPKVKRFLRMFEMIKHVEHKEENKIKDLDLVIFGYDRVGYDFVNAARKINSNFCVIDFNPELVDRFEENKIPYHLGDARNIDFLEEVRVQNARAVISTIPDFKTNIGLVSFYKNHNKNGIIIVISHNIKHTKELYERGASFVVMPQYLGANYASKMIENYGLHLESFEKEKQQHLEYLKERQKFSE